MAFKALLSATLVASSLARPSVPAYGPPAYAPAPVYAEPAYPDEAPVYQYTYAVKDDYSFSNFNAHEERDGYNAAGGYQVAQPEQQDVTMQTPHIAQTQFAPPSQ